MTHLGQPTLPFHHICIEVDDIRTTAESLAATFGAGPFYVIEHAPFDELAYVSGPISWDHSLAFGYLGTLLIEIHETHALEPRELENILGRRPIAHVAYLVEDLDEASGRLEAAGSPRVLFGRNGPVSLAYHDVPHAGLVELIQAKDFVPFWEAVAARTAEWDGTEPLRSASSLF